jgi:hypothetical protein
MRYLSLLAIFLFLVPTHANAMGAGAVSSPAVTLDLTVTPCAANTTTYVTSISCSLGVVPKGDLIRCVSEYGDLGPAAQFTDNLNGVYLIASYGVTFTGGYHEFLGKWYFPNSAGGKITVTQTYTIPVDASGFSCAAFKGAATINALDPKVFGWSDYGDATTSATLPEAATPIMSGELIDCVLSTGTNPANHASTASSSYVMAGANSYDPVYPMTWSQSKAAASTCPYKVSSADSWTILGNGFLPAGAGGGITPYQGFLENFSGLMNGSAPQVTALIEGVSGGVPGWFGAEADWYQSTVFTIVNNYHDLTGTTAGPTNVFSSRLYLPVVNSVKGCCEFNAYQTYSGNSPMNLMLTTGESGDGIEVDVPKPQNSLSWGYYLQWDIPSNDLSSHEYVLGGAKGLDDRLLAALIPTGNTMTVGMVGGTTPTTLKLGVANPNTPYWMTGQYVKGGKLSMAFYKGCPTTASPEQACTLVGSGTIEENGDYPVTSFLIGTNNGAQASGHHIYWRNVKWCSSYPCMP